MLPQGDTSIWLIQWGEDTFTAVVPPSANRPLTSRKPAKRARHVNRFHRLTRKQRRRKLFAPFTRAFRAARSA